jgi:hypothetical protein
MGAMHGRRSPAPLVLLAALAACTTAPPRPAVPPAPPAERRFEVPGQGDLFLPLPAEWTESQIEEDPGAPPTFQLEPGDGAFVVLLTPLWDPDDPEAPAEPEQARALAELARREMAASALEEEIPLEDLVGAGVRGYWFQATDRRLAGKPPPPGEWLHVLQGAIAVGRVVLAFTLLDDADGPQRRLVLDALRAARHAAPPDEEEDEEGAEVLSDEPLSVGLPGRSWSVLLDLPGFAAEAPRPDEEGRGVLAIAADTRTNAVASVLVAEASGVRDARACRDQDLARIRAAVEIRDLRIREEGEVARARYVVPEMDGRAVQQLNVHAWRFREGACVAVHLSLMDHGPEDEAFLERIVATLRLAESF